MVSSYRAIKKPKELNMVCDQKRLGYFKPLNAAISLVVAKKYWLGVGDLNKFQVREWCTVRCTSKVELIAIAKFPDLATAKAELRHNQTKNCKNVLAFPKLYVRS